jgi:asparagine synthase (glutamine-hydrolysing)
MADAISHRGPDDVNELCDPAAVLAPAHRGLAILAFSIVGHQPLEITSGRYVIVFKGKIYNHLGLRRELERSIG